MSITLAPCGGPRLHVDELAKRAPRLPRERIGRCTVALNAISLLDPNKLCDSKAERFIRTLQVGWTYGAIYTSRHDAPRKAEGRREHEVAAEDRETVRGVSASTVPSHPCHGLPLTVNPAQ